MDEPRTTTERDGGRGRRDTVPGVGAAPLEHRDHGAALLLAYRVLERIAVDRQVTDLTGPLTEARERHWHDVEIVLRLAQFSAAAPLDGGRVEAAQILEIAERSGDDALVGTALGVQAIAGAPHRHAPFPVSRARDLPQAVALLDRAGSSTVDRVTGYLTCGLGYHAQGLWELALDLYRRAERALPDPSPPALQPICAVQRAAIAVHRHQSLLALGCALIEVGRREAAQRLAAGRTPLPSIEQVPEGYRTATMVAELVLAVIAGEDPGAPATDAIPAGEHAVVETGRLLAAALRAHDRDDPQRAARAATAALAGLDGRLGHALHGLGLLLAAGADGEDHPDDDPDSEPDDGADREDLAQTGLGRFAGYQAGLRWRARQGQLETSRALIEAERLLLETERAPLP